MDSFGVCAGAGYPCGNRCFCHRPCGGGAMQSGWQKISEKWYYFNGGGDMVTGWKLINSNWYCFESSGVMVTGTKTIGNKTYEFDDSGRCLNP